MDGMIGFAVKLHVERHTLRRSLMATGVLVTLILGGALLLHDLGIHAPLTELPILPFGP